MNPFDRVASRYDQMYADPDCRAEDRAFKLRWGHMIRRPNTSILDVGCGTGWLLDHFDIDPRRYLGFDYSPGMIAQARAKHPHHDFLVHDMRDDWPIATAETYDLVVCLWASPNFDDPHEQMALAAKAVHPGGRVLYMAHTPHVVENGRDRDGKYLPPECYTDTTWRPWAPDQVRHAAIAAGLTVNDLVGFRPAAGVRGPLRSLRLAAGCKPDADPVFTVLAATKEA